MLWLMSLLQEFCSGHSAAGVDRAQLIKVILNLIVVGRLYS